MVSRTRRKSNCTKVHLQAYIIVTANTIECTVSSPLSKGIYETAQSHNHDCHTHLLRMTGMLGNERTLYVEKRPWNNLRVSYISKWLRKNSTALAKSSANRAWNWGIINNVATNRHSYLKLELLQNNAHTYGTQAVGEMHAKENWRSRHPEI